MRGSSERHGGQDRSDRMTRACLRGLNLEAMNGWRLRVSTLGAEGPPSRLCKLALTTPLTPSLACTAARSVTARGPAAADIVGAQPGTKNRFIQVRRPKPKLARLALPEQRLASQ